MKTHRKIEWILFLTIELCIYITFLCIDLLWFDLLWCDQNKLSSSLKWLSIVICCLYLYYQNEFRSGTVSVHENRLLMCALFLTMISDFILLFSDCYIFGVFIFLMVQFLYCKKLGDLSGSSIKFTIFRNLAISFCILALLISVKIQIDFLMGTSCVYFVSLISNVVDAGIASKLYNSWSTKIFFYGLFLFLLCDMNVGINNLTYDIEINQPLFHAVANFSTIGMWLFYLPSQVCIVASVIIAN